MAPAGRWPTRPPAMEFGITQMLRTGWFLQVHGAARRTMELRPLLDRCKTPVLANGDVENGI